MLQLRASTERRFFGNGEKRVARLSMACISICRLVYGPNIRKPTLGMRISHLYRGKSIFKVRKERFSKGKISSRRFKLMRATYQESILIYRIVVLTKPFLATCSCSSCAASLYMAKQIFSCWSEREERNGKREHHGLRRI